jgi:hypothetical protein
LGTSARELFTALDSQDFSARVEAMELRTHLQQRARDRVTWRWLYAYMGLGAAAIFTDVSIGYWGGLVILAYVASVYFVLWRLRNRVLEPRLDKRYPLSHRTHLMQPRPPLPDGVQTNTTEPRPLVHAPDPHSRDDSVAAS